MRMRTYGKYRHSRSTIGIWLSFEDRDVQWALCPTRAEGVTITDLMDDFAILAVTKQNVNIVQKPSVP